MITRRSAVLIVALLAAVAAPAAGQSEGTTPPAAPFVVDGACPLEGCAYGEGTLPGAAASAQAPDALGQPAAAAAYVRLTRQAPADRRVLYGVIGSAAGIVAGAFAGDALLNDPDGYITGAVIGTSVLLPLGVRWGAGRGGVSVPTTIVALVVGAAGTILANEARNPVPAMVVPPLQLVISVALEPLVDRADRTR